MAGNESNNRELTLIQELVRPSSREDLHQGAMIVLMYEKGIAPLEIARALELDAARVDEWIARWESEGVGGFTKLKVKQLEPRLRPFLPADLYARFWGDPTAKTLEQVFDQLRTLLFILYDYVPADVRTLILQPGKIQFQRFEGTLMFVDLVGFTHLIETMNTLGRSGSETLLHIISSYFSTMIEIITKSHGYLLEFTGDAMLIQFPCERNQRLGPDETPAQAALLRGIRAGLRMQRAMRRFAQIDTEYGQFHLAVRIGVHPGCFLVADIGTPRRMEHVLLGADVQKAKEAETRGTPGRVCISGDAHSLAAHHNLSFEPADQGFWLVIDDLMDLGDSEWVPGSSQTRRFRPAFMERTLEELVIRVEETIDHIEPLASYLPASIVSLLVENAERRRIPHDFFTPTVLFINLLGFSEAILSIAETGDPAQKRAQEQDLITAYSRLFSQINAVIERLDGTLKKVTYHLSGSDIMVFFGVPTAHPNDPERAVQAAITIREVVQAFEPLTVNGKTIRFASRIGLSRGPVFSCEIGQPQGRREFNIIGDDVNIAARLMGYGEETDQIWLTKAVYQEVETLFPADRVGRVALKGKTDPIPVFRLHL